MIIITSFGDFSCIYIFLVFSVCLILFHFILFLSNFTPFGRVVFFSCFVFALFLLQGFVFQWDRVSQSRLNLNPMEQGQYGQHVAGGNPSAYMSMRDYINQSWQSQQPVERNPSEYRSMRDYRNQWMSSPYGSTYNHSWGNHTNSSWEPRPPQYAPHEPPFYASTPESPQPPQ